jgi:hypothetical protein
MCIPTTDQQAEIAYRAQLETLKADFLNQYYNACLRNISAEQLAATSNIKEYQYTLYYYDQSGQLTQTIPPTGVTFLSDVQVAAVQTYRSTPTGNTPVYPAHTLPTRYAYTSLNGQISQISPDALTTRSWYDAVGRLVVSQDGRQSQLSPARFSYTLYDVLGRVIESGEVQPQTVTIANTFVAKTSPVQQTDVDALLSGGTRTQVTRTFYDVSPLTTAPDNLKQNNLRSRVSMRSIESTYDGVGGVSTYDYATHYDYDLLGNVKTLLQDITPLLASGHRYKRIGYQYDQLSGKVNYVHYQKGRADQYSFCYRYDLNNRLTSAWSSYIDTLYPNQTQGRLFWDKEAGYKYYAHGPLARTELGHYRVQGQDYAYTLQGWMKGLNSAALVDNRDMGRDGNTASNSNLNRYSARDVFSYTLGFYYFGVQGDYAPIGGSNFSIEPAMSLFFNLNLQYALHPQL